MSVRSATSSRSVSKSSAAPAPPLYFWDPDNNCGQMVLDAGHERPSTCRSADASGFIKCHGRRERGSTSPCTSGCRRRPARLASRVSCSFWNNLQVSFVTPHTSMIDVADLSMFLLLQTPSVCSPDRLDRSTSILFFAVLDFEEHLLETVTFKQLSSNFQAHGFPRADKANKIQILTFELLSCVAIITISLETTCFLVTRQNHRPRLRMENAQSSWSVEIAQARWNVAIAQMSWSVDVAQRIDTSAPDLVTRFARDEPSSMQRRDTHCETLCDHQIVCDAAQPFAIQRALKMLDGRMMYLLRLFKQLSSKRAPLLHSRKMLPTICWLTPRSKHCRASTCEKKTVGL